MFSSAVVCEQLAQVTGHHLAGYEQLAVVEHVFRVVFEEIVEERRIHERQQAGFSCVQQPVDVLPADKRVAFGQFLIGSFGSVVEDGAEKCAVHSVLRVLGTADFGDLLVEKLIVDAVYRRNAEAAVNVSDMYSYPMMWAGIRSFDGVGMFGAEEEKNLPKVIKLHGSLNWYWGAVTASDIVYYLSMEDVEKKKYQITSGLKPYIIPPVMDKNAFYDHVMIRHLWKSARELLREADEIYIIGFSMPQSDLSVKFLFQSALEHNNSKVFIVNTQGKKDLCDKYAGLCRSIDYRYAGKQEAVQLMMENILSDC